MAVAVRSRRGNPRAQGYTGNLNWQPEREKTLDELQKSISFDYVARTKLEGGDGELGSREVLDLLRENLADEIQKAMAINTISGGGGYGAFDALRLEDLDDVMSKVLFTRQHFVFQREFPRVPALQVTHQWNTKLRYGAGRGRPFFREGDGPGGSTSRYQRGTSQVRFLGVEGGITHQATMLKPGGIQVRPVEEENENRVMELMEETERAILFGDSSLVDSLSNVIEYDGIVKQILAGAPTENVIDLRGAPFNLESLDEAALIMHDRRYATDLSNLRLYAPGSVFTDLSKAIRYDPVTGSLLQRISLGPNNGPGNGIDPGVVYNGYTTQWGRIPFTSSVFMQRTTAHSPLTNSADAVGSAPAIAGAAAPDATSKMDAGTLFYFVSSVYDNGESVASAGQSVTVTTGQKANITITRPAVFDRLRGYNVYRSFVNDATTARWVQTVGGADQTSVVFGDLNANIPDTEIALLLHTVEEDIEVAQLAPMMRFPLAPVKTTLPFYYLMYHVPIIKVPQRMFIFKNIGRL